MDDALLTSLCRRWTAADPVRVEPLGTPGFSGSRVFVVELADPPGRFVLKSFPAGVSLEQTRFVHGLVRQLRAEGVCQVPEVMRTLDGDTVVAADGRLWELARLMPGVAVPCPSPAQAAAAAAALARVHRAAAGLPGHPPRVGISPGVARRIEQAGRMLERPWQVRRADWHRDRDRERDRGTLVRPDLIAALDERVVRAIAILNDAGGETLLERCVTMANPPVMIQPVLRDIWCEHVLFADGQSDRVTGIVDLHAAGIDTPATDLARLLGSWAVPADRPQLSLLHQWPTAVAAYDRVRPLSREEAGSIPFLHGLGLLCGLDNWFRWTLEEHREFPDSERVLDRLDGLLAALPAGLAAARSAWRS